MKHGLYFHYLKVGMQHAVAIAILTTPNSPTVQFQIATCNPKDQFAKKWGRATASARLAKNPILLNMGEHDSRLSDIVEAIVKKLKTSNYEGVKHGKTTHKAIEAYEPYRPSEAWLEIEAMEAELRSM